MKYGYIPLSLITLLLLNSCFVQWIEDSIAEAPEPSVRTFIGDKTTVAPGESVTFTVTGKTTDWHIGSQYDYSGKLKLSCKNLSYESSQKSFDKTIDTNFVYSFDEGASEGSYKFTATIEDSSGDTDNKTLTIEVVSP
ncbi:MAG: hypothetical protein PQJ46_15085 [Spirochaetales bacterium]|nr:hypothetical protein [Spirochaetales bacterium]